MSGPLLATKLYIPPPRPKVVLRPRLLERLNEGLHRKLTLISAPAGFGKTTLVSEWIAPMPAATVAWLSLDEGDNDPTRFLTYLIAALQTVAPQLGESVLASLHSPQPAPIETLLTPLINELTTINQGISASKVILVLDDYHLIDVQAIDQALAFLLDHLPPTMHLVITTREDPHLPLARLRARSQMTEVRAADLRFTPAEAAAFLNQVMALQLTPEEVSALERRTEGWIVGLQLAALSMQGRDDAARFVTAFTGDNRYIVDYLVEEVLQRQPPTVRRFLLQSSILDRLSGPLCDAVTGENNGTATLDALERANLFVVPLDDSRHWFRYHHLFGDLLAAHLSQEEPAQLPLLHQRASGWYAENAMPAEAIRHAVAAKDFARAAALIELAWPAMDGRFQAATWLSWAKLIPDNLVAARPVLSAAYGWAYLNAGDLEAAEARLADADAWLQGPATTNSSGMVIADEAQFRTLPASIATAHAYMAQARGDLAASVRFGQIALDLLPDTDHLRRGPAAALLGLAQWASGDLEAAYRTLAAAMAGFEKSGNLHFAISVTSGLASIRLVQGRLHDAIHCYTQALHLALAQGAAPIVGTADLYLGLSELLLEQGDHKAASAYLLQSQELGEQAALPDWRYRLCRLQARFQASQGDFASALDLLNEAERHFFRTPVPDLIPLATLKCRLWLAQGRLQSAQRWVREAGLSPDDELSFLHEVEHITLARVLLAEVEAGSNTGALQQATALLARLQQAAEAGGRMGSVITIALLQAQAHQAQGDLAAAHNAMRRALTLAEPEGFVRIFVDEGLPVARLLSSATTIMPAYVGILLAAFAPPDQAAIAKPSPSPTAQPLIEPLSAREIEVLQLIAAGLSNGEIGARLYLALSTVKGHNRNIFDKLQVERRTEAIARARELGII